MSFMKDEGAYTPQNYEDEIYKIWEEKGYFRAKVDPKKQPFTIVMPPPNVTSIAHIGHALDMTLQDFQGTFCKMLQFFG